MPHSLHVTCSISFQETFGNSNEKNAVQEKQPRASKKRKTIPKAAAAKTTASSKRLRMESREKEATAPSDSFPVAPEIPVDIEGESAVGHTWGSEQGDSSVGNQTELVRKLHPF